MPLWRLDKIIASQTTLSRREVKALILGGRVEVNGRVILRGEHKCDTDTDDFKIDDRPLVFKKHIYLVLNKPVGYVSSTNDRDGLCVLHLVPAHLKRRGLFPAGRLDKYSEGMLVITDNGAFAHEMLSPRMHVPKRYYVKIDKPVIDSELIEAFARGVDVGEEITNPAKVEAVDSSSGFVTINQGLYHQIRRMFYVFGAQVIKLERVQIGALPLGPELRQGECRELTGDEVELLLKPMSGYN